MPPALPSDLADLIGVAPGDTWRDRLREGAWTSPTGLRIRYQFVDLRRTHTKRGTAHEFHGVNNAYVQQKGFGPRRYPMMCFFSGPNHDLEATAFEAALDEPGVGQLEHPLYGTIDAVPFGEIVRDNRLVSEANQSVVGCTFWTTLLDLYPSSQSHPQSEIVAALGNFDVVAAQEFQASTSLATKVSQASAKGTVRGFLQDVSSTLRTASDATASVRAEFDDVFRLVNEGVDVLVGQPLLLARQLANLVRAPARALAGLESRLQGYAAFAERIFGSRAGRLAAGRSPVSQSTKRRNDFQLAQLMAMNAVGGSVESTLNHDFETKPEVLEAAEEILDLFDAVVEWSEPAHVELGTTDTGAAYQALHSAVALAAGFLVEVSFQVVPEKRLVLDRPRTIIDVAAEVYGAVDDRLDLLINSNKLSGSEILELPAGRSIVYYPS